MYKLETADMAKGYLKGHKYSSEMSAYNCFVLGQTLYEAGEYQYASEWLLEALHKVEDIENGITTEDNEEDFYDSGELDEGEDDEDDAEESEDIDYDEEADDELEDTDTTDDDTEGIKEDNQDNEFGIFPHISVIEILEYLPSALYNSGYRNLALAMNAKLLALNPENQYGLANWEIFSRSAKEESRRRSLDKPQVPDSKLQSLYSKVCNGEVQQTAREKRHLRCRYVTNNVPFYFVGPLKMEELNLEPFVAYYHQIIYDNEIKQIIGTVEGSIERSKVGENKHSRYDEVRVSKNSWLSFAEHPFLDKISKRLEDITGLTIKTGEPLQIANYGIAGHYGPHHDFFPVRSILK